METKKVRIHKKILHSLVEGMVKSPLVRHIIAELNPDKVALRKAIASTLEDTMPKREKEFYNRMGHRIDMQIWRREQKDGRA